jgi:hypothetical protein
MKRFLEDSFFAINLRLAKSIDLRPGYAYSKYVPLTIFYLFIFHKIPDFFYFSLDAFNKPFISLYKPLVHFNFSIVVLIKSLLPEHLLKLGQHLIKFLDRQFLSRHNRLQITVLNFKLSHFIGPLLLKRSKKALLHRILDFFHF